MYTTLVLYAPQYLITFIKYKCKYKTPKAYLYMGSIIGGHMAHYRGAKDTI